MFLTFEIGREETIKSLYCSPRVLDSEVLSSLTGVVRLYCEAEIMPMGRRLQISSKLGIVLQRMQDMPLIPADHRDIQGCDDVRHIVFVKVITYGQKNLHHAIFIAQFARETGYSFSHLRCLFCQHFGISLGKYILESKLNYASQLLQRKRISVTDVAKMTGFESLYAFSRVFKDAYGMPPKTYNKLMISGL